MEVVNYYCSMSLVSNFIGGISATQFNGGNKVSVNFDMDNSTFEELLMKQMDAKSTETHNSIFDSLGVPPGLNIEVLNIPENEDVNPLLKPIEQMDNANLMSNDDISSSEYSNLFNSFLGKGTDFLNVNNDLLDFAKKNATQMYNKYSGSVITGIEEFVSDALHL